MHIIKYLKEAAPNISIDIIKDVRGQLVTPQNTLTIPQAAHKPIGRPNISQSSKEIINILDEETKKE